MPFFSSSAASSPFSSFWNAQGECDVALHAPSLLARSEGRTCEFLCERSHDIAVRSAELEHIVDHLLVHTVGDRYYTVGTGDCDHFGAQFGSLLRCTPSHVTEARDGDLCAFQFLAGQMQHVLYEIECAETGSLRTEDRTAPSFALAGKNAGVVLASQFLIHTVQEADLTTAYAYVAGGNVGIDTDIVPQFKHESLAETHDFSVRLAGRIEVRTTLCTTHRKGRQGVLESLLETEELQHRRVHGLVETQTAFVGTDRAVELNAVAQVGLNFAFVVHPRYAEGEDTIRLYEALNDLGFLELRMLVVNFLDGLEYFAYGLQVFVFTRVLTLQFCH